MGIFLILLSICTYPVLLHVATEQQVIWHGQWAADIFMYFRSVLICITAILVSPFIKKVYWPYFLYLSFLTLAVFLSPLKSTTIFGTPNYYEGYLVICAYLVFGMYGRFPERAAKWVVYIVGLVGIIQVIWGCYFKLAPIHFFMPKNIVFDSVHMPIDSTFGNPNHLGLFCAILLPFFLARRKAIPSMILLFLLMASQCRGAWLSVIVTTLIQFRKQWKI